MNGSAAFRLTAAARRCVLDHLAIHGPAYLADIPRSWPVTRALVRWAVQELVDEGTVRWVGMRAPRRITLTAQGMRERCGQELPVRATR